MAQTRTQIRRLTTKYLGTKIYVTGTSDTGGGTAELVDSLLGLYEDNRFLGTYLYMVAADADHQVYSSTQSGENVFVRPASGASLNSLEYELLPFPAKDIHTNIEKALDELYNENILGREVLLTSLVSGSPGFNQGFELFASTNQPTGYVVDSGTVTQVLTSNFPFHEPRTAACRINNGSITVNEEQGRWFVDHVDQTATLYCWAQTAVASTARISLQIDGTENYSDYHTGGGDPELLSVTVELASTDYDVLPKFLSDTANNADFTHWWVEFQDVPMNLPFPVDLMPNGPESVEIAQYEEANRGTNETPRVAIDHGNLRDIIFDYERMHAEAVDYDEAVLMLQPVIGNRRLYVRGLAPLTKPTSNASVVEVTAQEAILVAKRAAILLLEDEIYRIPARQRERVEEQIDRLRATFNMQAARITKQTDAVPLPWMGLTRNNESFIRGNI